MSRLYTSDKHKYRTITVHTGSTPQILTLWSISHIHPLSDQDSTSGLKNILYLKTGSIPVNETIEEIEDLIKQSGE